MTTTNTRHDSSEDSQRPMTNRLHSRVYGILISLTAWFGIAVWSFAGAGVVDYLLFIVSGIVFVAVALLLILSRVGHRDEAAPRAGAPSLRDWARWDYDTWTGRLPGAQAATQILLPIAAAAVGMTLIGIVFHLSGGA
jgi:hypothetical protein